MELRHLRYFVAVAEDLHFGRAAARLRTAQSSLSSQIRDLEDEVGADLFHRTKRQVQLTDAGRAFLEEARSTLKQAAKAIRVAQQAARGETGKLGIGFVPSADCISFPEILRAFKRRFPEIAIDLQSLAGLEQIRALKEGQIDIGFMKPPTLDGSIASETIIRESFVAVLATDHPLAKHRELTAAQLAAEPLLLCGRQHAPVQHDAVVTLFRSANLTPNILLETDHVQTILGLVAAGIGVSVLPAGVETLKAPNLVYRRLRGSGAVLEMAVAYRRHDPSMALSSFLGVVRTLSRKGFGMPGAAKGRRKG